MSALAGDDSESVEEGFHEEDVAEALLLAKLCGDSVAETEAEVRDELRAAPSRDDAAGAVLVAVRSQGDLVAAVHLAAHAGMLKLMSDMLAVCPEAVYATSATGMQPLHIAARAGNLDIVQMLVRAHERLLNLRSCTYDGSSAAPAGMPSSPIGIPGTGVRAGFRCPTSDQRILDVTEQRGKTALHFAATYSRYDVVALLLRAGWSPRTYDLRRKCATDMLYATRERPEAAKAHKALQGTSKASMRVFVALWCAMNTDEGIEEGDEESRDEDIRTLSPVKQRLAALGKLKTFAAAGALELLCANAT